MLELKKKNGCMSAFVSGGWLLMWPERAVSYIYSSDVALRSSVLNISECTTLSEVQPSTFIPWV